MLRTALICLLLSLSAPAFAIYKCEAEGRITYSQEPCASGAGTDMRDKIITGTTDRDAAQARARATREKAEADRLEKARHQREAMEEKEQQKIARASNAKQKKCQSLALRKKWLVEDAAKSSMKSAEKARKKIARLEEKIAQECGK
jgi:hypothetical protein